MEPRRCPMCVKLEPPRYLKKGEGRLDQSGQTHLPTTTWTCECGYKEFDPAKGVPWKNNAA